MFKNYDINHLVRTLKTSPDPVVLFGAGKYGKLALHSLSKLGVKVSYFCDDENRNDLYLKTPVITPEELSKLGNNPHIFICCSYAIEPIFFRMKEMNFENIYNCVNLFDNTDFSDSTFANMNFNETRRRVELYKAECNSLQRSNVKALDIKYIDIVVTEACSMKCQSCSNLMQYYLKPKNVDLDLLFKSVDKIMEVTDNLYEFRLLGGEPFVNVQIGKIVNKLLKYKNAKNVVIYSNATIIPKGENFECLKNNKVLIDITDYGEHSRKHKEYIKLFEANNIRYTTNVPVWTDSGTINYQKKSEEKLKHMFKNCCVNDIMTLLNGKLYRCPFSANIMNLNAIPIDKTDLVDLTSDDKKIETIKSEINNLYKNKSYLTACSYCNGRDYTVPKIKAAIQTKKPFKIPAAPSAASN